MADAGQGGLSFVSFVKTLTNLLGLSPEHLGQEPIVLHRSDPFDLRPCFKAPDVRSFSIFILHAKVIFPELTCPFAFAP